MTARAYLSGFCGIGRHEQCRGLYAGVECGCECRHRPPEPPPPSVPVRHCASCTCEGPR